MAGASTEYRSLESSSEVPCLGATPSPAAAQRSGEVSLGAVLCLDAILLDVARYWVAIPLGVPPSNELRRRDECWATWAEPQAWQMLGTRCCRLGTSSWSSLRWLMQFCRPMAAPWPVLIWGKTISEKPPAEAPPWGLPTEQARI